MFITVLLFSISLASVLQHHAAIVEEIEISSSNIDSPQTSEFERLMSASRQLGVPNIKIGK